MHTMHGVHEQCWVCVACWSVRKFTAAERGRYEGTEDRKCLTLREYVRYAVVKLRMRFILFLDAQHW